MGIKILGFALLCIVALIVAALSVIQRDTVTVHKWSIQFVDQLDRPFVGLKVEQSWQNYSLEGRGHVATETTNEQGIANFPARHLRVSMLRQVLGQLKPFLFWWNIHAGYGPHSMALPECSLRDRGPVLSMMRKGQLPRKTVLKFSGGGWGRRECAAFEAQAREADRLIATQSELRREPPDAQSQDGLEHSAS